MGQPLKLTDRSWGSSERTWWEMGKEGVGNEEEEAAQQSVSTMRDAA